LSSISLRRYVLAKSLSVLAGQPCDRTSAALAIARGHLIGLDRAEVRDATGRLAMHSLLSLSWRGVIENKLSTVLEVESTRLYEHSP